MIYKRTWGGVVLAKWVSHQRYTTTVHPPAGSPRMTLAITSNTLDFYLPRRLLHPPTHPPTCALHLRQDSMSAEAAELAAASFGEVMLHTVGRVYQAQADIFLGGLFEGSLAAIRAKGHSLRSQVGWVGQRTFTVASGRPLAGNWRVPCSLVLCMQCSFF